METDASDPSGNWPRRSLSMERDLQFIYFLLSAPVYKGKSPNLFERLQQYGSQAGKMEEELRQLDPGQPEALLEFENRFIDWKAEVYEFLESKI